MKADKNISRLLGAAFLFVAAASALSGLMLSSLGISAVGSPDNISETIKIRRDTPMKAIVYTEYWILPLLLDEGDSDPSRFLAYFPTLQLAL